MMEAKRKVQPVIEGRMHKCRSLDYFMDCYLCGRGEHTAHLARVTEEQKSDAAGTDASASGSTQAAGAETIHVDIAALRSCLRRDADADEDEQPVEGTEVADSEWL